MDKSKIKFADIVKVFKERVSEKEAIDIAETIFQENGKDNEQTIKLS